jgi:hypothetical protein
MSKGEQTARAQLSDPQTSTEKDITLTVGRYQYRFELWADILGKKFWKRARLPRAAT